MRLTTPSHGPSPQDESNEIRKQICLIVVGMDVTDRPDDLQVTLTPFDDLVKG